MASLSPHAFTRYPISLQYRHAGGLYETPDIRKRGVVKTRGKSITAYLWQPVNLPDYLTGKWPHPQPDWTDDGPPPLT